MSSLNDFYKRLNLIENPFVSYTPENEDEKFKKLFIQPDGYEDFLVNFNHKNSIILTGDRGVGKTTLINDLITKIDVNKNIVVRINEFSDLKKNYSSNDFYIFIIRKISSSLFSSLADHKSKIRKLENDDKLLLSYLLKNYVDQISRNELNEKIKRIQIHPLRIWLKKFEKFFRGILNYSATVTGNIIEEYIAKHFSSLPKIGDDFKIKEILPDFSILVDEEFNDIKVTYSFLQTILALIKRLEYSQVILIIDSVDEDPRFKNDAEMIANFIKPILTDNKLLLEKNLQIIFSTWITPFNFLINEVRTQKHYCQKLYWSKNYLIKVLNKRLEVFSSGGVSDYKKLFADEISTEELDEIIELSNSIPRDLWHIFKLLLNYQYSNNSESSKIDKNIIFDSLSEYVVTFNYYEYYPRGNNSRGNSIDVFGYINYLLKLESDTFTIQQFSDFTKVYSKTTATNYISGMERIGLISQLPPSQGKNKYKIKDKKVIFAIKHGLKIIKI